MFETISAPYVYGSTNFSLYCHNMIKGYEVTPSSYYSVSLNGQRWTDCNGAPNTLVLGNLGQWPSYSELKNRLQQRLRHLQGAGKHSPYTEVEENVINQWLKAMAAESDFLEKLASQLEAEHKPKLKK